MQNRYACITQRHAVSNFRFPGFGYGNAHHDSKRNNTEFANEAIIYVERVGDRVTLKGRYRYIDNDGDQFHGLIRRNQGTIKAAGASGNGISVISGGTGKYEGIRGKCPYDVFYKPQGYMVVPAKCSWLLKR